jgi:DNA-binding transcriptional LysR family regulator
MRAVDFTSGRPASDGLEEAAIEAAGSRGAVRGRLRVNMGAFLPRMALANAIGGFFDAHRDLESNLSCGIWSATLCGRLDFGATLGEHSRPLRRGKAHRTRVLTVAAPSYIAAHGRPTSFRDRAPRCIDFWDAANKRPYEWEFRRGDQVLPVEPHARLMTSDPEPCWTCVAGAGTRRSCNSERRNGS